MVRTVCRESGCSAVSGVPSASSVLPLMPFIGVRRGWLMLGPEGAHLADERVTFFLRHADVAHEHAHVLER